MRCTKHVCSSKELKLFNDALKLFLCLLLLLNKKFFLCVSYDDYATNSSGLYEVRLSIFTDKNIQLYPCEHYVNYIVIIIIVSLAFFPTMERCLSRA